MTSEQIEAPEHGQVQGGDNLLTFAERHGVHPDRVTELNRQYLEDEARARGFDPVFMRAVPDEHGGVYHHGVQVRMVPEHHVFQGQTLRLREPEPKE